MPDNIIFYSTNSDLSYFIATSYYNKNFYVWCSPVFDPTTLSSLDPRRKIPASSSPHKIYFDFKRDVADNDMHSSLILQNKTGLKKGALEKYTNGEITDSELVIINTIIDTATISEFKPLLFLIPAENVKTRLKKVDSLKAAHPLSEEYILADLKENEFEVIKF